MKLKILLATALSFTLVRAADPLPSWNDTASKQAIATFVEKVTTSGSPGFVPVAERIATFDNDGCLWSEQPMYFQLFFALDRVKALAPQHPEWQEKEPFASVLKGDLKSALAGGEHALVQLVMSTHAGMTTEEFEKVVNDWITTAGPGPRFGLTVHHSADSREWAWDRASPSENWPGASTKPPPGAAGRL